MIFIVYNTVTYLSLYDSNSVLNIKTMTYFFYIKKLHCIKKISGEECYCRDWHGCIMQQSIVGMENIQPYKFSDCSLNDYIDEFRETRNMCLLNKPNEVKLRHFL